MENLKIQPAAYADFPAIAVLIKEFWKFTAYDDPYDHRSALDALALALSMDLLFVLVIESEIQGFIAGVRFPLICNSNIQQVAELGYWINPEHRGRSGLRLLETLETAAISQGAKYVNMISMESSDPAVAESVYKRRGYTKAETTWIKHLRNK